MNKILQYQSILQNQWSTISGTIFSANVYISRGQVIFQYKHGYISSEAFASTHTGINGGTPNSKGKNVHIYMREFSL